MGLSRSVDITMPEIDICLHPPSPRLKNQLATIFIIVQIVLATSITHESDLVTTTEIIQVDIPQSNGQIKKSLLQVPLRKLRLVSTSENLVI